MTTQVRRPRISSLVAGLPPSGIREFFDIVATMDDVVSLGVGEPDFPTPWHICDEVYFALRSGETSYTSNWGLLELRSSGMSLEQIFLHLTTEEKPAEVQHG